jgi:hypothetical protein
LAQRFLVEHRVAPFQKSFGSMVCSITKVGMTT